MEGGHPAEFVYAAHARFAGSVANAHGHAAVDGSGVEYCGAATDATVVKGDVVATVGTPGKSGTASESGNDLGTHQNGDYISYSRV